MKAADGEALVLLILCLAVAILLSHVVHVKRFFFLTEASVSLLVGLAAGGALLAYYAAFRHDVIPASLVEFNTQIFFDALLPPIIFNAGFSVKKKAFFRNFVTLVLFGVLGTMMTSALIFAGVYPLLRWLGVGAHLVPDALSLGTIFSSSDSVATLQILDQDAAPVLYSLVFGEGVVNDATSIVLLRAVQKISNKSELTADTLALVVLNFMRLFVLSLLLGVSVGLASAFLIRRSFVHHSTDREVSLVALLGFLAYLLAEELGLSGIFSIFFAGLTMSHYTWHALSPSAKVVTVYLFRILSFTSELFLFLYAGFSMWSTTLWQGDIYSRASVVRAAGILAAALVLLVFAARAATLLPLCLLANTWRPPASRISLRQAAVIWWAGSMRGAVTVAMAFQSFGRLGRKEPMDNQLLVVAANAAVTFITVALGAATAPLLARLLPPEEALAPAPTALSVLSLDDGVSPPLLSWALQRHLHWNNKSPVYRAWQHIDERWLYPLFGGRAPRGTVYRSPPCSPGREVIQRVMGPAILKRMAPGSAPGSAPVQATQRSASAGAADGARAPPPTYQPPGTLAALGGQGPAEAAALPPPPSTASTAKSGRRHHDAFRLRPAPSDGLEGGPGRGPGAAASAAPSLRRTLSTRSGAPEALDMLAEDAVEELFQAGSGRLDSSASQQLDWRDSAQFGEAAWLAAGAPSDPSSGSGGALGEPLLAARQEDGGDPEAGERQPPSGATGPPSLSRKSPFQGRH